MVTSATSRLSIPSCFSSSIAISFEVLIVMRISSETNHIVGKRLRHGIVCDQQRLGEPGRRHITEQHIGPVVVACTCWLIKHNKRARGYKRLYQCSPHRQ